MGQSAVKDLLCPSPDSAQMPCHPERSGFLQRSEGPAFVFRLIQQSEVKDLLLSFA
jgi:hypothetical protein